MFTFRRYALWFTVPALAVLAAFALYPVLHSLVLSFFALDLHRPGMPFCGLMNYRAAAGDPRVWLALLHTGVFTVAGVALELAAGLVLALLLQRQTAGMGPARALAMAPWVVPSVVAALLWRWIFGAEEGLLNILLARAGHTGGPVAFLAAPLYAGIAVVICEVWKTTPFVAILLLAGLRMIPGELYESARIDGAGPWQRFRFITLPLMRPAILIALLFRTMDALRIFDTVYVLTGGGPGNTTETLSLYTYKVMFSYLDMGRGAALAMLMFAVVAVVSLGYLAALRRTP
jgi:multiple sugar transport system permease protein